MYPRPIPEDAPVRRFAYAAMVALVLILWLVPLAAVMATSLRSFEEVMAGNYWGWPKSFNFVENYTAVFTQTAMAQYFLNSLIVTLPSVLGVLVLSTLTGFVLSRYRFRGANLLFALELDRRATVSGSRLVSTAAHPGVSATNLVASQDGMGANPLIRAAAPYLLPLIFQSAAKGANPTLYAATRAEPGSYTGPQWLRESRGPIGPAKLSRFAQDEQLANDLWALSEEKTGVKFAL